MFARRWSWLLIGIVCATAAPAVSAQSTSGHSFFLKKGDVVVVMGDSITEQRLYSNYLELWSQTRFPSYNLVFRNVGIGGGTPRRGQRPLKPPLPPPNPPVLPLDLSLDRGGPSSTRRARPARRAALPAATPSIPARPARP